MTVEKNLVSIIVPVYNVEKYIRRCIESLIQQTYKNIQIIIVNDGTIDNSISMISDYIKADNRIEVYDKENGGLSDARNFAFKYVRGKYVCFVDSDDWIEQDYIEILLRQFEKEDSIDLAIVDFDYAYDNRVELRATKLENGAFDTNEALILLCNGKTITNHVWNKMYRTELFNSIRFEKGRKFEDIYIMHQIFSLCRKVSTSSRVAYHYYMRDDSIMHETSPQNEMDIFIGYKQRYDFFSDKKLKEIVLKFCAWSCYKVLFLRDSTCVNNDDLNKAISFWKDHSEIAKLGLKYLLMYRLPHLYKSLISIQKL